jgi:hypothetical protein
MAWRLTGTYYSSCSCNVGCPCIFGEMEGDQGWCSGTLVFDVRAGDVDGTDVSGTKVVLTGDFPSGFLAGNGKGRIYFDPGVSQEQRSALEPVFSGRQGGIFELLGTLVPDFLPAKEAPISIQTDEQATTRIKVGDFGAFVVQPLRGPEGDFTRLLHGSAAFRDDIILAKGTGSRWQDPEMRQWESGGHAEQADFDWSA